MLLETISAAGAVVQPSLPETEIMRAGIPTAKADYPTKLVRLIEPFGQGSGPEVVATAVGRKLAELWGQPVTVENHPGAGSTAAPAMVARSPADVTRCSSTPTRTPIARRL